MSDKIDQAFASMAKNLEDKTGKSLAQWVKIAKAMGELKHSQIVNNLKAEHGIGHGYANLIAHSAAGTHGEGAPGDDALIDAQYAGEKVALRPIYDKLAKAISGFGSDAEFSAGVKLKVHHGLLARQDRVFGDVEGGAIASCFTLADQIRYGAGIGHPKKAGEHIPFRRVGEKECVLIPNY